MLANDSNICCYQNNVSTIYEIWMHGQFYEAFESQQLVVAAYKLLNEPDSFIRESTEILRDYRQVPGFSGMTMPAVNPPKAYAAEAHRMIS